MSATAYSCWSAVAGASDRFTLKLDAGSRVEKARRITIGVRLTSPAELLHPTAANLPFRPIRDICWCEFVALKRPFPPAQAPEESLGDHRDAHAPVHADQGERQNYLLEPEVDGDGGGGAYSLACADGDRHLPHRLLAPRFG